jgi:hypothetical protein
LETIASLVTFIAAFAETAAAPGRPGLRAVDVGATIAARLGATAGFVTFAAVFSATGARRLGLRASGEPLIRVNLGHLSRR